MLTGLRLALGLALLTLASCGEAPPPPESHAVPIEAAATESTPCNHRDPLRNAYFGDLHVHTALSSDAWMFDVRLRPDDAYRYAFGERVLLPPNDKRGHGTRAAQIDRPLDFAAVTDHAEFLGELTICTDPAYGQYDSDFCRSFRGGSGRDPKLVAQIMSPFTWRYDSVCGDDNQRCREAARAAWTEITDAAEQWNDESAGCRRTSFIAYEYTSHRLGSNLHRNVIFRNSAVPRLPISYIEAPREWELWQRLKSVCRDTDSGCDVIAIPHNANISNGRMFNVDYIGANSVAEQAERARLQVAMEPIVEIMQHKGDAECRDGMPGVLDSEDELCRFEKFEDLTNQLRGGEPFTEDDTCAEGWLADKAPHLGPDCISRLNYARYALIEGLKEEQRIGVNPFKFGLSASTDTHNALAGGVAERDFPGHLGTGDDTAAKRRAWNPDIPGNVSNNPGGLIGVWAPQNNRSAIFDALRRKEVFGTSGPRIRPRLFGAWQLPEDLCQSDNMLAIADASGVPMGGDLPVNNTPGKAPLFLAAALADPGKKDVPGTPLQRLQIIKGWINSEGHLQQRVFEVAGNPNNGASVNPNTCEQKGKGFTQLCALWRDPDFDPALHAVYYLRAVENPSCRYNAWQCAEFTATTRPASCDNPNTPKVIRERAWTSPIWYTPPAQ